MAATSEGRAPRARRWWRRTVKGRLRTVPARRRKQAAAVPSSPSKQRDRTEQRDDGRNKQPGEPAPPADLGEQVRHLLQFPCALSRVSRTRNDRRADSWSHRGEDGEAAMRSGCHLSRDGYGPRTPSIPITCKHKALSTTRLSPKGPEHFQGSGRKSSISSRNRA